jgi:hypothetical protein
MKRKYVLISFGIIALAAVFFLLMMQAYYVLVAMVVGLLLLGSRELWSLIRYRRMPVFDERVHGNMVKAVRNAGIFFVFASIFLLMVLSSNIPQHIFPAHIVALFFVAEGAVYLFSYLYYDRAEPYLGKKSLRWLRIFISIAGIAPGVFILSVILHNLLGGLLRFEEPVFFIIAVIVSPAALAVGALGSMSIVIKGLIGSLRHDDDGSEADENED